MIGRVLFSFGLLALAAATWVDPAILDACPGYNATNIQVNGPTLTADLVLAGKACNVFGPDIPKLTLQVVYETESRIHLKVTDPTVPRYEVPASVLPRPSALPSTSSSSSLIGLNYTASPFSFTVYRSKTKEVLFSTVSHPIIFEPQYIRVKTVLPANPNIYGLGEHTDPFHLPTNNYTRTLWSRDAFSVPPGTNLYGNHPIYFDHRKVGGTHGVFLLNSNGMDIKINQDPNASFATLEYNVIGGVIDLYFLAGSETDPSEVARQYAQVVGTPAEVPYWSFGLHQCRFGYHNYIDVAGVISNYSAYNIPLETMWTDIDYMYNRRIFTTDPVYFPLPRMQEIVSYLHSHSQKYILMTDPAIAYAPGQNYSSYDRAIAANISLKAANGSDFLGVVWPGVTVFPDWFHPNVTSYWNNEFMMFYNPTSGIDIDGAWIDMNEPSSFCNYPCTDPFAQARAQGLPPPRTTPPPSPNATIFMNSSMVVKRQHMGDNLLTPLYAINNNLSYLSDRTAYTTAIHANGLVEYDTHNIFGTMMSTATRGALLYRRPGLRPLVITRSTFAGAGNKVGKWLGDNISDWIHYRNSIAGILGMATVYQVPMVGADICGFGGNTTETLCARWATLGGFYPFMRNHNIDTAISQEFYRWPLVAQAARNVLSIRYRLMDYMFTAFHRAHIDGTPVLNPLWFKYPQDSNTYSIDLQFLYGDSILVSPVTQENYTTVDIYLPNDVFYDFNYFTVIEGQGKNVTLSYVPFTDIPVYIRGGSILPLRANGTMTTTELRATDFEIVVATGRDGTATGSLYVDDGVSVVPANSTWLDMTYENGKLTISGSYDYPLGVNLAAVYFLGVGNGHKGATHNGNNVPLQYQGGQGNQGSQNQVATVQLNVPFNQNMTIQLN